MRGDAEEFSSCSLWLAFPVKVISKCYINTALSPVTTRRCAGSCAVAWGASPLAARDKTLRPGRTCSELLMERLRGTARARGGQPCPLGCAFPVPPSLALALQHQGARQRGGFLRPQRLELSCRWWWWHRQVPSCSSSGTPEVARSSSNKC